MSSPFLHPRQRNATELDWARLIPGTTAGFQAGAKKPVRSVSPIVSEETPDAKASTLGDKLFALLPSPLQGRMAARWMRSMAADVALVGLNWLLLGALLVPLHRAFPQVRLFGYDAGRPFSLLGIAVLHATLIVLMGHIEELYAADGSRLRRLRILCKSVLWATIVLCFAYLLQGVPWTIAALIWVAGAQHCGALLTWRWQLDRPEQASDDGLDLRRVLIVGGGGVGRRLASSIEANPRGGRVLYGILDDGRPVGNGVIGRVGDLARLARTGFVDEVILAAPQDRSLTQQVLREARRLRLDVTLVPELFGCAPGSIAVERAGDLPVLCLHAERSPAVALALKRFVDVVGAGLALMFLSPMLAVIAALIRLDSPGGVLYRAQRVGRKGRLFRCYKFRTMVRNADDLKIHLRSSNQRSGPCFKIADDPRITSLGRFLRRYSLDELPQLWNVVKGEMSLVGPRPHPVDDFAEYEIGHLARLDVTPGITGLWQVTARRDPSFERGMALDREYIRTWSLGTDIRILLKTVLAVARGSGD